MEGKCALFKEFADVDAFPLCVASKDVDEIVNTIRLIAPSFGGINLEDIAAPRCFEIEERLKRVLDIPVFHDDQHGTAIVALAALINAAKLAGKKLEDMTLVINGAGAAGIAVAKLMLMAGIGDLILCDINGILYDGAEGLNPAQMELAKVTNRTGKRGILADALRGADAFLGVSRPNLVTAENGFFYGGKGDCICNGKPNAGNSSGRCNKRRSIIVGTGRSDYPNQINNVLAFPGIFKGALQARVRDITDEMKLAAAYGIASIIPEEELRPEYILPDAFNKKVAESVAKAVYEIGMKNK